MNATPFILVLAGLVLVLGSWIAYLATVPGGKVPRRPIGHMMSQAMGIALAFAAMACEPAVGSTRLVAVIIGAPAIAMGSLFFYLLTQRKTPLGTITIKVGGRLHPFSATSSNGSSFHTDSFAGKRVLLKFFRGHW